MDDGKYYWLEATWDDQTTGVIYNYFLVGNNHFLDHTAELCKWKKRNFIILNNFKELYTEIL